MIKSGWYNLPPFTVPEEFVCSNCGVTEDEEQLLEIVVEEKGL